ETLAYMRFTGRPKETVDLVEAYCKEQSLFRTDDTKDPEFSDTLELDLADVEPSLAGPKRPQDRVALGDMKKTFRASLRATLEKDFAAIDPMIADKYTTELDAAPEADVGRSDAMADVMRPAPVAIGDVSYTLRHGAVVIAAITSCTNTSNPAVMLAAGLL